jgi:hypothetical protein
MAFTQHGNEAGGEMGVGIVQSGMRGLAQPVEPDRFGLTRRRIAVEFAAADVTIRTQEQIGARHAVPQPAEAYHIIC